MHNSPEKQMRLATKAKLSLSIAILLVLSTLLVVYLHFAFFSDKLSHTRSETIPALVYSTTLAQQGKRLRDQMEQAISTTNPLIQQHIVSAVRSDRGYGETLQALRQVHATPELLVTLENEFRALQELTVEAITIRMRQGKQQEHLRYIRSRLLTLLQKLSNTPPQSKADQKLIALTTRLLSRMLSVYQEEKEWVVSTIFSQCTKDIAEQKRWAVAYSTKNHPTSAVETIFHEVGTLLTSPGGLMANKKRELSLSVSLTRSYTQASFIATNIVQRYEQLLKNAENNLQTAQEHTIAGFDTLQSITFLFLMVLVLLFAGVYLFLLRNVLTPILNLTNAIQGGIDTVKKGHEYTTPLPMSGEQEIQAIAKSTTYFLQEISAQRAALAQSHAQLEEQVRVRTKRITALSGKLIHAQETERKRLAAELHDDIGATMSVIKMGIEHISYLMRNQPLPMGKIQGTLKKQKELIQQVTSQLRTIQTDLSPPYLALGLQEALRVLCEDYNMMHVGITFVFSFSAANVPERLHLVLYRILQEGLTNIVKHSQCSEARIALFNENDTLIFSIEDNGIPFTDAPSSGMGLKNIEERGIVSGGTLKFEHHGPWKGFIMEWPLREEA